MPPALAISSTVVAGLPGVVDFHWHGSPYTSKAVPTSRPSNTRGLRWTIRDQALSGPDPETTSGGCRIVTDDAPRSAVAPASSTGTAFEGRISRSDGGGGRHPASVFGVAIEDRIGASRPVRADDLGTDEDDGDHGRRPRGRSHDLAHDGHPPRADEGPLWLVFDLGADRVEADRPAAPRPRGRTRGSGSRDLETRSSQSLLRGSASASASMLAGAPCSWCQRTSQSRREFQFVPPPSEIESPR